MSRGAVIGSVAAGIAAFGAGCVAYGTFIEARSFVLREYEVSVLPPGAEALKILHLSDVHLLPNQRAKQQWVRGLAELSPDLVVNTGDNHAHPQAWPLVLESYGPLLDVPGVFVWGSNDYRAPNLKNPLKYFAGPSTAPKKPQPELPWRNLRQAFTAAGWHELTNSEATFRVKDLTITARGTDDPHLRRDRYQQVAGPIGANADLSLGVTHAPYLRVLDAMADDGLDVILAGHTHGGQVCVPGYGALVTNCDIDTGRVKGLSSHTHGGHTSVLEVSAGLGSSPMAPYRFACWPEASLLTLVPRG